MPHAVGGAGPPHQPERPFFLGYLKVPSRRRVERELKATGGAWSATWLGATPAAALRGLGPLVKLFASTKGAHAWRGCLPKSWKGSCLPDHSRGPAFRTRASVGEASAGGVRSFHGVDDKSGASTSSLAQEGVALAEYLRRDSHGKRQVCMTAQQASGVLGRGLGAPRIHVQGGPFVYAGVLGQPELLLAC